MIISAQEQPSLALIMADQYKNQEQRILLACEAARREQKPKIASLARQFHVPYQRLRARINDRDPRSTRIKATRRLSNTQESAWIEWIRTFISAYCLPTAVMIQEAANILATRDSDALLNKN